MVWEPRGCVQRSVFPLRWGAFSVKTLLLAVSSNIQQFCTTSFNCFVKKIANYSQESRCHNVFPNKGEQNKEVERLMLYTFLFPVMILVVGLRLLLQYIQFNFRQKFSSINMMITRNTTFDSDLLRLLLNVSVFNNH